MLMKHMWAISPGSCGHILGNPGRATATAFFLWMVAWSGCAMKRTYQPDRDTNSLSSSAFQAYLNKAPLVTVDEAYRAIGLLENGEEIGGSFSEREQYLADRGIIRREWKLSGEQVIDAGSVAYMVARICHLRGGVNYNLFGRIGLGDRRYALRELIYLEMWGDVGDYQVVTGGMLTRLLAKADKHMAENGLYEMKVHFSDETDRGPDGELIVPPPVEITGGTGG